MTTKILHFLYTYNPNYLSHCLDSCGLNMHGEGILLYPNDFGERKHIPFDEMNVCDLEKIYRSLVTAYERTGRNPAPYERQKEYEELLQSIRVLMKYLPENLKEMSLNDETVGHIISDFGELPKESIDIISKKLIPGGNISYSNYKQLKELLQESIFYSELDYYPSHDNDAAREFYKAGGDIKELPAERVRFLFDERVITEKEAVRYFRSKNEYLWTDIENLVLTLIQDESQFETTFSILKKCNDNGIWRHLWKYIEKDTIPAFLTFLSTKCFNISRLDFITVHLLCQLGVITKDQELSKQNESSLNYTQNVKKQ